MLILEDKRGLRAFFGKNKGGEDFFQLKERGEDLFSREYFPKPGLGTR